MQALERRNLACLGRIDVLVLLAACSILVHKLAELDNGGAQSLLGLRQLLVLLDQGQGWAADGCHRLQARGILWGR